MDSYAKMMGGDLNSMRSAFRPSAEKQAKASVPLETVSYTHLTVPTILRV